MCLLYEQSVSSNQLTFINRDFAKTDLPAVAKIVKGQHQNLGVPTLSNPSLQSTALFLNAGKKYQILAQPIKIKEGRKPSNVGKCIGPRGSNAINKFERKKNRKN